MDINMKTPHEIAEDRILLSAEYQKLSSELADLMDKQTIYFTTHWDNHKSDKSVERAFDSTPEGMRLNRIKLRMKAIDKQFSASRTMLDVLTNESRNLY
jgi:hypothetical protein